MATYVLVGGAWIGAWAWKSVAADLRARGHDVYPVSLTGLGERVHLARPEVDLETHMSDVTNLLEFEELSNVVLVGHSYAGSVITGAADRAGDRLGALVYLDSGPFFDGESQLDFYPPPAREQIERIVTEHGEGWRFPFPSFEELGANASLSGLTPRHRSFMQRHAVDQPFRTYSQPLRLNGSKQERYQQIVIACEDGQQLLGMDLPRFQAINKPPWRVHTLETGHWPMLSTPDALAEILDGVGTSI